MKNTKPRILVVDDEIFYLDLLTKLLSDSYEIQLAKNGEQALRRVNSKARPNLILLDVTMPGLDGYQVCEKIKTNILTRQIPIIFLTAKTNEQDELKGFELGAVDYITKPITPLVLKMRVKTHLALSEQRFALQQLVQERTKEIETTKNSLVYAMGAMAEMRDEETGNHLLRTEKFVEVLARGVAEHDKYKDILNESMITVIHKAAPLHDVGKVGVPDRILQKASALDEQERQVMNNHPMYGKQLIEEAERLLGTTDFIQVAKEITYCHHEKWDGSGYPEGLSGDDIPLSARLMALADVYDALASKRCYKEPMPHEKIILEIEKASGTHFDPELVDVFLAKNQSFQEIFELLRDDV
jgi:putative two-component system response regulator